MRLQRMLVPLSLALMGLSGCNVYERWDGGEFNAGPVDSSSFPPEYLGGGNRQRAGAGSFTAKKATTGLDVASRKTVEYFLFPFSTRQRSSTDPLVVRQNGAQSTVAPTPNAYVFDGCSAPEGYTFDADRDDVPYNQQGVIFSALPVATYAAGAAPTSSYVPVVSRVPVTSQGVGCQRLKSEKGVVASTQVSLSLTEPVNGKRFGIPDETFHAYAIIEPGAAVFHADLKDGKKDPSTGVGLQSWGWYNQYLLAYLDGGQVPTAEGTVKVNGADVPAVRLVAQKLYYPRSQVTVSGANKTVGLGQGYDVVTAARLDAGYSPVCQVLTYDAGGPLTPDLLPKTEAEVLELVAAKGTKLQAPVRTTSDTSPAGDPYVYCLQLQ